MKKSKSPLTNQIRSIFNLKIEPHAIGKKDVICVFILLSLVELEKFWLTTKDLKQIAKGGPSTGLILPTLTHYDIHLLWTTIGLGQTAAFFDPTNHLNSLLA